jgi:ATP-dependent Clp protease ATP-binding subunit ClpA
LSAADFERFSDDAHRAVVLAERVARESGRESVDTEHLLVALADVDPDARALLEEAGTSAAAIQQRVAEWGHAGPPVVRAVFSPSLHRAVQRAGRLAQQERAREVTGRHLLRGLLEGDDESVLRVLLSLGVDPGVITGRPSGGGSGSGGSESGGSGGGGGASARRRFALLRAPAWKS